MLSYDADKVDFYIPLRLASLFGFVWRVDDAEKLPVVVVDNIWRILRASRCADSRFLEWLALEQVARRWSAVVRCTSWTSSPLLASLVRVGVDRTAPVLVEESYAHSESSGLVGCSWKLESLVRVWLDLSADGCCVVVRVEVEVAVANCGCCILRITCTHIYLL